MAELIPAAGHWAALAGGALALALALAVLLRRASLGRREAERLAHDARARLATITETMREGVVAYDLDLRLVFVNPAFERLTGYPADEIRDLEFLQYIHPDDRAGLLAEWDRLARGGSLRDQEYRIITRTGQVRWSSSAWEPLLDEAGHQIGYLGTEFDITERKVAEAEMRQDAELFQAVLEVQQAVAAAGLDSRTVMHVIAERCQRLTGADGAVIETIEGEQLVPQTALGVEASRIPLGASLSGLAVRSGELQRSDDTATDPRVANGADRELGFRALLAVPLKDEQRIVGVLKVVSRRPQAFSDRDAKALRMLGGLVGAALGHAAAYEGRQSRLEERTLALQETEQRFKQLVDVAQEGIWVADDRGTITYVNQRMAELLGYQNGALLGRRVYDLIDPTSRPSAQRVLTPAQGGPARRDLRFRRKDGSELWALVSASPILGRDGVPVGTVGLLTDITERKRAEDRLRRSAERLAMLHDMDQAILAARSPAEIGRAALGRIRRMVPCQRCSVLLFDHEHNEAATIAEYAGGIATTAPPVPLDRLPLDEPLRQGTTRCLDDITAQEDPPPLLRQLAAEGMRSLLAVPLLVEGEAIGEIVLASATPGAFEAEHRDIALEAAAPLAIAIQQARLREEMTRQSAALERRVAERGAALRAATAELEGLLYALSHDLRPPLRHLGGFAQLLLEDCGPGLDPAARHYGERIRGGAMHMAELIDDLLRLSRIARQDLMRRPVSLTDAVEDVVAQLQPLAEGRTVDWELTELPAVEADPALVRMALVELLANALKFTRSRERAVIRVRPLERDGYGGLAVEDNGVGFKMTHAGKLFTPFQRLHRADEFEGNGAGLALVQRIVLRHGGRVWAEAAESEGATFYLTLGPVLRPRDES